MNNYRRELWLALGVMTIVAVLAFGLLVVLTK